jgi:phage protein D
MCSPLKEVKVFNKNITALRVKIKRVRKTTKNPEDYQSPEDYKKHKEPQDYEESRKPRNPGSPQESKNTAKSQESRIPRSGRLA